MLLRHIQHLKHTLAIAWYGPETDEAICDTINELSAYLCEWTHRQAYGGHIVGPGDEARARMRAWEDFPADTPTGLSSRLPVGYPRIFKMDTPCS